MRSADQYGRIAPWVPGKATDARRTAADKRLAVEAALWAAQTGRPWRELLPMPDRGTVCTNAAPEGPKP